MKRFFRVRYLLVLIIALIVATGVLGFAATNNVDPSSAGDGATAISGYDVHDIHYNLSSNFENIESVNFTLSGAGAAAQTVSARLIATAPMTLCSWDTGAAVWHCDVPDLTVLAANNLRVIAAQ